ncbi:MAG: substrate-binding domain-containing protein [Methylovirgula sp.]
MAATLVTAKNLQSDPANEILNVSYDPTRELYGALDAQFVAEYLKQTGIKLHIKQSHGGSSRQARSVIDGSQKAGVVTLALPTDVETLAKRGLIAAGWQARLPNNSVPYTSTVVFVVERAIQRRSTIGLISSKATFAIVTPNPRRPATAN